MNEDVPVYVQAGGFAEMELKKKNSVRFLQTRELISSKRVLPERF